MPRDRERLRGVSVTKEDLIVLCEEAIDDLDNKGVEGKALSNLHEIRATLIEGELSE